MRFLLFRNWVMPEYQPIEKNRKIAKIVIFGLATFRSGLKFMKKFVVIYHAPAEAMAAMATATPEQKMEGMKPWMAWADRCGDQLVDLGTPLIGGQRLSQDGSSTGSEKEVSGYSILQAEDMAGAKALLDGHPHLQWAGGCDIEVHECAEM